MRRFSLALAIALRAFAAQAGDGQLEINHSCAAGAGCFPGDTPGYPVQITQPGSYRLTSNLSVPAATHGIVVTGNAAIDLGGFEIAGPVNCTFGCPAPGTGTGITSAGLPAQSCSVGNGRIRGFAQDGVVLGRETRVGSVTITDIARHGLDLGGGSFVKETLVSRIGQNGMRFAAPGTNDGNSLYRDNTISVTGAQSVVGGAASGRNACLDQLCGTSGKKFFYLSPTTANGAQADSHCAPGFHMASLYEIFDPSQFEYDTSRGVVRADSGQGPPVNYAGWIRTGNIGQFSGGPGRTNCDAWAELDPALGSIVTLSHVWDAPPSEPVVPWNGGDFSCSTPLGVWCVQD
jgi:hypothetical protein